MPNKTRDDDVTFIRALAEVLNDNELTELQVKRDYGEDDSLNVRISRKQEVAACAPAEAAAVPSPATAPAPPAAAEPPAAGTS